MVPDILALHEAGLGEIPVKVFGGVALNNHVGGLNPYAVDLTLNLGGRIVWFPTLASPAHIAHVEEEESHGRVGFINATITVRPDKPISILDESGRLKEEVYEILDMIKDHDVILTGGHLPAYEIEPLITAAQEQQLAGSSSTTRSSSSARRPRSPAVGSAARRLHRALDADVHDVVREESPQVEVDSPRTLTRRASITRSSSPTPARRTTSDRSMRSRDVIRDLIELGYKDDDIKKMVGDNAADLLFKDSDFE